MEPSQLNVCQRKVICTLKKLPAWQLRKDGDANKNTHSLKLTPSNPVIFSDEMMIRVSNHLLSKVFRFHYHCQMEIGSIGKSKFAPGNRPEKDHKKKKPTKHRLPTIQPSGVFAVTLPETSSKSPPKMNAWNTILSYWVSAYVQSEHVTRFCCLASPRGDSTPLMEICDAKKTYKWHTHYCGSLGLRKQYSLKVSQKKIHKSKQVHEQIIGDESVLKQCSG